MLPHAAPDTAATTSRAERWQRIFAQLQAQATPLLAQMADTLVDAPDRELFRSVEVQARDLGRQLAAATQQTGLDDRKKGAT